MQVTKQEFIDWKHNPVTTEIFEMIKDRVEESAYILTSSAGLDPANDRFYVGLIHAMNDLLNITYED